MKSAKPELSVIGMPLVRRGKVPIEVVLRPLRTRRVDLTSVETLALLGIRKQIVGAGDFLEFLFGRLVAGIEIRVQFFRKFAVCLLDIGGQGRRGHAENLVRISHDQLRKNLISPKIMRAQNREICNTLRCAATRSAPAAARNAASLREGCLVEVAPSDPLQRMSSLVRARAVAFVRIKLVQMCFRVAGQRVLNCLITRVRFRAKACPGLDPGWIPVRVKKTRQN